MFQFVTQHAWLKISRMMDGRGKQGHGWKCLFFFLRLKAFGIIKDFLVFTLGKEEKEKSNHNLPKNIMKSTVEKNKSRDRVTADKGLDHMRPKNKGIAQ